MLFAALGKAEPLISTAACQKFDLDLWPSSMTLTPTLTLTLKQGNSDVKTQFQAFDLDLWPTTLTYNPILAKVKVDPHAKNQGRRSNGSAVRAQTNGRTDGRTDATKCIISLASRSIKMRIKGIYKSKKHTIRVETNFNCWTEIPEYMSCHYATEFPTNSTSWVMKMMRN